MNFINKYILIALAASVLIFSSCGADNFKAKPDITKVTKTVDETELLYGILEKSGNYINQKSSPNIIGADDVFNNLKKYHIIDIRTPEDYVAGHIDGAVNVQLPDVIDYVSNEIEAGTFEKVIMVCYSGQKAGYASGALRLLGFDNVYSLKWGMSAWDKNTADKKWLAKTSNKYADKLEINGNSKHEKMEYPKIETGETTAYSILKARAKAVLADSKYLKSADEVFENPDKYYVINYWKIDDYIKGHIPGSVMYPPKASLTRDTYLPTLPTDKPVVIYCYTGQHASYVAAYLRILGYDAYCLSYGANSFMHSKLTSENIGHAFGPQEIKNYPMVVGDKPSLAPVGGEEKSVEPAPVQAPVIINNTKPKGEEGGC